MIGLNFTFCNLFTFLQSVYIADISFGIFVVCLPLCINFVYIYYIFGIARFISKYKVPKNVVYFF